MPHTLNRAEVIGYLGQDPDLRYTSAGTAVANLSVATDESYEKDDETVDRTEWHRITCWDSLAEVVSEHLQKGARVYVAGTLQTRSWDDRDGNERRTTEINAADVIFLGTKGGGSAQGKPSSGRKEMDGKDKAEALYGADDQQDEVEFEPDDSLPF